ncbi:ABC transporter permease [Clostridium thailandense]|uniref:ABC transporter permease n=1 Tax=Clostridium thailandense TaxID=2794346 RepID=UPI003988EBC1
MIIGYEQLTVKYLKTSRKRTLLTIIGIVLSVALVCSIGLFVKGMQAAQVEDMKNSYGSWHIAFSKVNENMISKVVNNPKVSRYGFYSEEGSIKIGEKLKIEKVVVTDKALELAPCKLKQGRMPENKDEVVAERWVLNSIDKTLNIGSKIKFDNKDYTIVGILEDNIQSQVKNEGTIVSKDNNISKMNAVLLVEISSKTNLKKAVDELSKLGEPGKFQLNEYVLTMEGAGNNNSVNTGFYMVVAIIIGIVIVSTIAVIYNSFQISVVERIKQFGLLRAVGATPKQIRKIVLREATILTAIGVPLGLLCGITAIYIINFVFKLIGKNSVTIIKIIVEPKILIISLIIGVLSIYASALIPAFFAGRISPLVAISSRNSITKEKIKRRKSKISGKLFGFEGVMASKNIKRNRKRYRITVFSIVISVVLFVTFKSFMDMALNIYTDLNEEKNIHFSIIPDRVNQKQSISINDDLIDKIKSIRSVDKIYKMYEPYSFRAAIDPNSKIKEVENIKGVYEGIELKGSNKTLLSSSISAYDSNSIEVCKKYLKSGKIDVDELNKENGVILVKKSRLYKEKEKKDYFGPLTDLKVGDEISVQYDNSSKGKIEFGKGNVKSVKIMAILEYDPFAGPGNKLKMITTENVAKNLTGVKEIKPEKLNILIKDTKDEEIAKTQIENIVNSNTSLKMIDNIDNNRTTKSSILMSKILIYGFVIVVSLIGSVNIINTITTNIILRKREFAALKSIGLTQKGLKKMIVLEGILYGIVGTIYGSIIGSIMSFILYRGLFRVREFSWSVPWNAIVIAGIAAIIIAYISVLSPLSRIKRENLIETIREDY